MSSEHDDGAVHDHVTPIPVYLGVFGALIFFTLLTVGAYNVHLGELNLSVAIAIATVKGALVVAFFMHMLHEKKFNLVVLLGALVFVTVFLGYTMNDTQTRGREGSIQGTRVDPTTGALSPVPLTNSPFGSQGEGLVLVDGRRFEDLDVTHPGSAAHGEEAAHAEESAEAAPTEETAEVAPAAEENADSPAAQADDAD